jgi:hypothetical protein
VSERAHIPLKVKLASALLQLRDEHGAPLIPYEHAKAMSAEQIISLFQWDHGILHAIEPIDEPWNLTPRLIPPHREKSARDTTIVAHTLSAATSQAIHDAAMASKAGDYGRAAAILAAVPKPGRLKPKKKIASRPFQQGHRPLRWTGVS